MAAAALTLSTAGNAATITFASVTGPTGTVWDTDSNNGFYLLNLQNPLGSGLNPNNNFSGFTLTPTTGDFQIAGDGWPTDTTNPNQPAATFNSDPYYTLTLNLSEGASTGTITARYTIATGTTTDINSLVLGSGKYSISGFNWLRGQNNVVGSQSVGSAGQLAGPGSRYDYQGAFGVMQSAVPEPAIWGMMIAGFGVVGFSSRRRRAIKTVTA